MEYIDSAREYRRAFRFGGIGHFMADTWVTSYRDMDAMVTTIGDDSYFWFPQESIDKSLSDGVRLFGDQAAFDVYYSAHSDFLVTLRSVYEVRINKKQRLEKVDMQAFVDLVCQIFIHYRKTEFFYVDAAYEHSQTDPVIRNNLMKNYALKERARIEALNAVYAGKGAYLRVMLHKLATQFDLDPDDLWLYGIDEGYALFDGERVGSSALSERTKGRIVASVGSTVHSHFGDQVVPDIRALLDVTGETAPAHVATLKGMPASKGKVRGRVKVIISDAATHDALALEFEKMQQGDILVTETTSPELMPACRKAAAILADQGGLLSHAAVISREFGIPAIVGLRHAAQILKDGDLVEVDAEKGMVTVLERT